MSTDMIWGIPFPSKAGLSRLDIELVLLQGWTEHRQSVLGLCCGLDVAGESGIWHKVPNIETAGHVGCVSSGLRRLWFRQATVVGARMRVRLQVERRLWPLVGMPNRRMAVSWARFDVSRLRWMHCEVEI